MKPLKAKKDPRQFSSNEDSLSIHGSKQFCGSESASGQVRSPHIKSYLLTYLHLWFVCTLWPSTWHDAVSPLTAWRFPLVLRI